MTPETVPLPMPPAVAYGENQPAVAYGDGNPIVAHSNGSSIVAHSNGSSIVAHSNGHPILRALAAFPIALFTGALLTDLAYLDTANVLWVNFSAWLLAFGMAMGIVAALAAILAWMTGRLRRGVALEARRPVWPLAIGSLVVLVVAFVNNLVHSRDAWTAVVPEGIVLSAITVLLIIATIWAGSTLGRTSPVVTTGPVATARPAVGVRS